MPRGSHVFTPARRVLMERGITAKQVATDLGLSVGVTVKVISGRMPARPYIADPMAEYLGVDVEELFPGMER